MNPRVRRDGLELRQLPAHPPVPNARLMDVYHLVRALVYECVVSRDCRGGVTQRIGDAQHTHLATRALKAVR